MPQVIVLEPWNAMSGSAAVAVKAQDIDMWTDTRRYDPVVARTVGHRS
jgi:hypothetical protein